MDNQSPLKNSTVTAVMLTVTKVFVRNAEANETRKNGKGEVKVVTFGKMYRERSGPDPKPEKRPKPKQRKVRKKPTDKKEQVNQLIIDLDTVFSIFIRQRGMDSNGLNQCYTCGKFYHWTKLQCGHYLSRRYYGTRWSEENARPQCVSCNLFHEGNKPAFTLHLIKDFGLGYLDKLEILKNRIFKIEAFNLQLLIKEFKGKIK